MIKCFHNDSNSVPTMLGVNDTAEMFGLSKHFVRRLALSGQVKAVRVSSSSNAKILINCESLRRLLTDSSLSPEEPVASSQGGIQPIPVKL
jgi:hypothetical protein